MKQSTELNRLQKGGTEMEPLRLDGVGIKKMGDLKCFESPAIRSAERRWRST